MTENYSVLIVDDSYADRYLLKRVLDKTDLSLTIIEAESGIEALDILTTPKTELVAQYPEVSAPITVFLDINMPIMTGWEFLEELDRIYEKVQLKPSIVIMYTTSNAAHEREKAKSYSHVENYLTKDNPSPDKLAEVILACHS